MALCPEHPKRDQNPKFTPQSETTSHDVVYENNIQPKSPTSGLTTDRFSRVFFSSNCQCLQGVLVFVVRKLRPGVVGLLGLSFRGSYSLRAGSLSAAGVPTRGSYLRSSLDEQIVVRFFLSSLGVQIDIGCTDRHRVCRSILGVQYDIGCADRIRCAKRHWLCRLT